LTDEQVTAPTEGAAASEHPIAALYSERARNAPLPANQAPDFAVAVNFDQGLPDPRYFPVEKLQGHLVATLEEHGRDALRYFSTGGASEMQYGYVGLRNELAAWMAQRDGRRLPVDGITLVNGSTDGLALAVNAFLGPGDGAVVEAATYPHTKRYIAMTGATVRATPIDDHGMDVDKTAMQLERMRADGVRPKLIYTIPTFHAPTGTVMPRGRREELIALAKEWHVMLLEDNCYYAFAYDESPPPTLLALDDAGFVLQSDSFSKYVAPGLRLAWLAGDPVAIDAIVRVRQDFAVSQLLARAMERYVASGDLDLHLAELRDLYRTKRDITSHALRTHCEPWVRFREPAGGFYFWLEVDERVDWDIARAHLAEQGIAFRPGDRFVDDGDGRRFVRISPIQVPTEHIAPGIAALGDALARAVRR
jgi:2-aminoadipate transaminase